MIEVIKIPIKVPIIVIAKLKGGDPKVEFLTEEIIYKKTPQELTALLYEGLMENLESAIVFIEEQNYIEANKKLQKANDILHRLGVGLKYEIEMRVNGRRTGRQAYF